MTIIKTYGWDRENFTGSTERISRWEAEGGRGEQTFKTEGKLAEPGGVQELIREKIDIAVSAALQEYADGVTDRLQRHRSRVTGTRAQQTEQHQRWAENRIELADGVRINEERSEVYIDPDVEWLGLFLEYGGYERVYWGRPSGEIAEPQPFMRPAFQEETEKALRTAGKTVKQELE